jgi:hypothetical protein
MAGIVLSAFNPFNPLKRLTAKKVAAADVP